MKHAPAISGRALGYRSVQVLDCVQRHLEAEGQAPSYGMIASELGLKRHKVCRYVETLERRGLLRRVGSGRVRRIKL